MSIGPWYGVIVVLAGCWFLVMAIGNALFFLVSRKRFRRETGPMISVLVPARNEARRIGPLLEGLSKQTYHRYEVVVIDDNSTDGTWDVLTEAAAEDSRIRVLRGKPLADGWKGKPYAMVQLAAAARGEILLFVDADMEPERDFVSWVADRMIRHDADSLSAYALHRAHSVREYLFFPIMYMVNMTFIPFWLIKKTRSPLFSHAVGQIMAFKRDAYHAVGGFGAVRDKILEDIQMARTMKIAGFRHIFLDARRVLSGFMYESWDHIVSGLERSIYEYFDKKIYPLVVLTIFMAAVLVFPPILAAVSFVFRWPGSGMILAGSVLTLLAWGITLFDRRIPWYVAFPYPVQFGYIIFLGWKSMIDDITGRGYLWKGRKVL